MDISSIVGLEVMEVVDFVCVDSVDGCGGNVGVLCFVFVDVVVDDDWCVVIEVYWSIEVFDYYYFSGVIVVQMIEFVDYVLGFGVYYQEVGVEWYSVFEFIESCVGQGSVVCVGCECVVGDYEFFQVVEGFGVCCCVIVDQGVFEIVIDGFDFEFCLDGDLVIYVGFYFGDEVGDVELISYDFDFG